MFAYRFFACVLAWARCVTITSPLIHPSTTSRALSTRLLNFFLKTCSTCFTLPWFIYFACRFYIYSFFWGREFVALFDVHLSTHPSNKLDLDTKETHEFLQPDLLLQHAPSIRLIRCISLHSSALFVSQDDLVMMRRVCSQHNKTHILVAWYAQIELRARFSSVFS